VWFGRTESLTARRCNVRGSNIDPAGIHRIRLHARSANDDEAASSSSPAELTASPKARSSRAGSVARRRTDRAAEPPRKKNCTEDETHVGVHEIELGSRTDMIGRNP